MKSIPPTPEILVDRITRLDFDSGKSEQGSGKHNVQSRLDNAMNIIISKQIRSKTRYPIHTIPTKEGSW